MLRQSLVRSSVPAIRAILVVLVVMGAFLALSEAVFFGVFRLTGNPHFSRRYLLRQLTLRSGSSQDILGSASVRTPEEIFQYDDPDTLMLHPYLGYVGDPGKNTHVNDFGWLGEPPLTRQADRYVLGITGGSFAEQLAIMSGETLAREIKRLMPALEGRDVRIVSFASGGYKEPQQLLAYAYLLSLGYSFDALVNIDGFNELALPYADNRPLSIAPYYPRRWNVYAAKAIPPAVVMQAGYIAVTRESRKNLARLLNATLMRHTIVPLVIWDIADRMLTGNITRAERAYAKAMAFQEPAYQQTGPKTGLPAADDEDGYFRYLADIWQRGSEQLAGLADANGTAYLHILQPNQYVPGSKPFSATELNSALFPDADGSYPYRDAVVRGYALLSQRGSAEGTGYFRDFTQIFRSDRETRYADTCCHLTNDGYDIVAAAIARELSALPVRDKP